MNTKLLKLITLFGITIILIFSSCDKNFGEFFEEQFNETSNLNTTLYIDGQVAVPILNTSFSLQNFIPTTLDSTLWVEIDAQKILHLRMYIKDFFIMTAQDLYGCPMLPIVPADSISFSSDTNKIKIYDNAISGHVFFYDPQIKIILFNQIPVVTFFTIDTLRFHSSVYNQVFLTPFGKQYINRPSNPTQITKTEILLNKTNIPNLENIFSPIPQYISFFVTAGNDQPQTINLTDYPDICSRKLWGDVDIDLPIDARVSDLTLSDTIPFETFQNIEQIDSAKLKLFIDNDIPLGAKLTLSFVDSLNTVLLTPFNNWEFEPAQTDANGFSILASHSKLVYSIDQSQVSKLATATKIILTATLNTYNSTINQNVKVLSTYKMRFRLGVKINYKANSSQL